MKITTTLLIAATLFSAFSFIGVETTFGQRVGERRTQTIEAKVRTKRGSGSRSDEQVFQIPPGWRIVAMKEQKNGYGHKYSGGVSVIQANSEYYSLEQVKSYYKEMTNLALKKGKADLAAKLNSEGQQREEHLRKLMSTHKTVVAKAWSSPHWSWVGAGASMMRVKAIVTIEFVGTPQSFDSQMKDRYDELIQGMETQ